MLETLLMALWTGSALAPRVFPEAPNSAPTAQHGQPQIQQGMAAHATPGNVTCVRSGRLMSASPAKALAAPNSVASTIPDRRSDLFFCIIFI
jgi:hypothetical protein